MFISLYWTDINERMKQYIINKMLLSFNKLWNEDIYNRFTKKSCIVDLYYENNILEGVCISWCCNNYFYLDKFFSINHKKGVGSKMISLYIEKYSKHHKLLWRTDLLTSQFYNKHKNVISHFIINKTNNINNNIINNNILNSNNSSKSIIYMGVNKKIWEYEDIYNLKIKSCFYE
jgi:hypothetical protein